MSWVTLHWTDRLIEHQHDKPQLPFYVPAQYVDAIIAHMSPHGFVCRGRFPIPDPVGRYDSEIWIDPGGMAGMGAPRERLDDFYGAPLGLRSEDVVWAARRFAAAGEQIGDLWAYSTWMRFLILTTEQRLTLVAWLTEILPQAEARAAAFWADRQTPQQMLAAHNVKLYGESFCGNDKLARFKEQPDDN